MKIYIIGIVGSGKSTLATRISNKIGCPVYHLDQVAHQGDFKRPEAERNKLFQEILAQENYIIEDVGRTCFTEALHQVDKIIFLDLPARVIKKRIITRFIKQKLGLEKSTYRPSLQILRLMLTTWQKSPAEKLAGLKNVIRLTSQKEVENYLNSL